MEKSTHISDSRYQSLYPGDKTIPITVEYRKMHAGFLQYLDEHPEKESLFAEAFIDEIKTSPCAGSLITLIEMLRVHTYAFDKKSFFTDELVMEIANQVEIKTDMLEKFSVEGRGYPYRRENLQFMDGFVYKAYGFHLVKA